MFPEIRLARELARLMALRHQKRLKRFEKGATSDCRVWRWFKVSVSLDGITLPRKRNHVFRTHHFCFHSNPFVFKLPTTFVPMDLDSFECCPTRVLKWALSLSGKASERELSHNPFSTQPVANLDPVRMESIPYAHHRRKCNDLERY